MTKKITMSALALLLALAGAAFANGQKEPPRAQAGNGPAATRPLAPWASGDKLSLTGTLTLEGEWHPVLKSGGKEYELMVPRYLTWNLDVKEGEQISVEGYVVQGMHRRVQGDDNDIELSGAEGAFLLVTKATIKGKDYDLSQSRGPMMGMGGTRGGPGRGGRGGNRGGGPGRGMMAPAWGCAPQS